MSLDHALAEGDGIPGGNLLEIAGHSDSSKTALALWFIRTLQTDPNTIAGWVCTENSLTLENLHWAGIRRDRPLIVARQCPSLPGLDAAKEMVDGGCNLVVIDSIAALMSESEDTLRETLGRGLGPLKNAAEDHDALVILINQERHIGLASRLSSSGASIALLRACRYRVHLRTGEFYYRGGIPYGNYIHFRITCNGDDPDRWGRFGAFKCHWLSGLSDLRRKENP